MYRYINLLPVFVLLAVMLRPSGGIAQWDGRKIDTLTPYHKMKGAESTSKLLGCWTEKTLKNSRVGLRGTFLTLCFKNDGRLFGIGIGENGLGGEFEGRWKYLNRTLTISDVDQYAQRCSIELLEGPKLLKLSGCKEAGNFDWDRADFDDPKNDRHP